MLLPSGRRGGKGLAPLAPLGGGAAAAGGAAAPAPLGESSTDAEVISSTKANHLLPALFDSLLTDSRPRALSSSLPALSSPQPAGRLRSPAATSRTSCARPACSRSRQTPSRSKAASRLGPRPRPTRFAAAAETPHPRDLAQAAPPLAPRRSRSGGSTTGSFRSATAIWTWCRG